MDDKRSFDLISYNRSYHFQAEDEADQKAWMSVLINCKERALAKSFQHQPGLLELQKALKRHIQNLPVNDKCCDCGSGTDVTWISINSRMQALTLDNLKTPHLMIVCAMDKSTKIHPES
jgi:Arf-GAP/SH3 domain/ANK repeat/PH domain-containing protein